jgi:hypothetical protein
MMDKVVVNDAWDLLKDDIPLQTIDNMPALVEEVVKAIHSTRFFFITIKLSIDAKFNSTNAEF